MLTFFSLRNFIVVGLSCSNWRVRLKGRGIRNRIGGLVGCGGRVSMWDVMIFGRHESGRHF